jgi:hypothetical protein
VIGRPGWVGGLGGGGERMVGGRLVPGGGRGGGGKGGGWCLTDLANAGGGLQVSGCLDKCWGGGRGEGRGRAGGGGGVTY